MKAVYSFTDVMLAALGFEGFLRRIQHCTLIRNLIISLDDVEGDVLIVFAIDDHRRSAYAILLTRVFVRIG
jgi:hypothetical protein